MAEDIVWYEVELDTNDGAANRDTLQAALASNKYVKIKTGSYPLTPYVTIDSTVLDLGGSTLTMTETKYSGALIRMRGDSPIIQNGTVSGICYDKGRSPGNNDDGTPKDSELFESERGIGFFDAGFTNAQILNVEVTHIWGYGISGCGSSNTWGGVESGKWQNVYANDYRVERKVAVAEVGGSTTTGTGGWASTTTATNDGWIVQPDTISLTDLYSLLDRHTSDTGFEGHPKYVSSQPGGIWRDLSSKPIDYIFTLSDGTTTTVSCYQGLFAEIPSDAVSMDVTCYFQNSTQAAEDWKGVWSEDSQAYVNGYRNGFNLIFSKHSGGLTIRNCTLHHNCCLGMTGTKYGPTYVYDTESYMNGRADGNESTGKNTTTGFIDVEDSVTGYLLLQNCNSHDEGTNSAMLHCCTVDIKDCTLKNVLIYGGAWANVENTVCSSTIGYQSASVITPITMENCTGHYYSGYDKLGSTVTTSNCTFYNLEVRDQTIDSNGTYYYEGSVQLGNISGFITASIYKLTNNPPYGITGLSPEKGSALSLFFNYYENGSSSNFDVNPLKLTGDAWIKESDICVVPNGYTLSDCTFNMKDWSGSYSGWKDGSTIGTYDNCVFNLDNASFVKTYNMVNSRDITFKSCTINNSKNYMFTTTGSLYGSSNKFTFIDCTIADYDKICEYGSPVLSFLYSVTSSLKGCSGTFPETIERGSTATISLAVEGDYTLPTEVTVAGATSSYDAGTGVLTVSSPIGPVTVTAVAEGYREPTVSASLRTLSGQAITSLSQLFIRTAEGLVHPVCLYDRHGNEIILEGLATADGYILMTSDGLIFVPKGA
jgi:hypothetical protein